MAQQHTLSPERILPFFLAGRALFTLRSKETDNRFTYKIRRNRKERDLFFIMIRVGHEYRCIATYKELHGLRIVQKNQTPEVEVGTRAIIYTMSKVLRNNPDPRVEVWHEGRCGKCGRVLTVPESLSDGLGPECSGRKFR